MVEQVLPDIDRVEQPLPDIDRVEHCYGIATGV